MIWIVLFVVGMVALSFLIGGVVNVAFLKLILIFAVGMMVVTAFAKMWEIFK